jgi:hypothetical protein
MALSLLLLLLLLLVLQALGGVVSAEEIAPFLDPPPLGRRRRAGPNKYEDESFVLPALIRFRGEPFVDDNGGLLYKFPELQVGQGVWDGGQQAWEGDAGGLWVLGVAWYA